MSRSYKRTPVCKDGNASKKEERKSLIRKTADLGQKFNLYKKEDMNLGTFVITDFMRTVKLNST